MHICISLMHICISLKHLCIRLMHICIILMHICISLIHISISLMQTCISLMHICLRLVRICIRFIHICMRLVHLPVSRVSCLCIMDASFLSHLRTWMKQIKCAEPCFDMTLCLGEYPVYGTCTFGTWTFGTWSMTSIRQFDATNVSYALNSGADAPMGVSGGA